MHTMRRAFRGYRAEDVEERLRELEAQLDSAALQREKLEKELQEARQAAREAGERLAAREDELGRVNRALDRLRREQTPKKNGAETIGCLYLKAFESGREIVRSPQPHVQEFLAGVENAAEKARDAVSGAEQDFAGASGRMAGIVEAIRRETEFLLRRLEELSASVGDMRGAFTGFERIREAALADVEGIRLAYERQVSEYLDGSAENPPLKEAGTSRREERSAVEERPQAAEAEAAEPVEPATAPEEAPYADPAVEAVPATETPGGVEETAPDDTAADFRDEPDGTPGWSGSRRQEEIEGASARENSKEAIRGQNILNLLSKYQKR